MPESGFEKPPIKRTKVYGVLLAAVVAVGSLVLVMATHEPKSAVSSTTTPVKAVAVPQIAGSKSDVEILFRGKGFSVLKRNLAMPFTGEISEIKVSDGQPVKEDDVLAVFKLDRESLGHVHNVLYPERVLSLRKAVEDQKIEIDKIDNVSLPIKKLELDQIEKDVANFKELASKQMAAQEAVRNKERELTACKKRILEIQDSRKQAETSLNKASEDLRFFEAKQKRDVELLEWQTKRSYSDSRLPIDVGYLKAPISGHVIWMSPQLNVRAELPKGFEAARVASVTPMVVRCKVHELDLVRLRSGDKGTVIFDALPNKKYACAVTRIPWISRNPELEVPADYEIECVLENPDDILRDGLTCNVKIRVSQ